MQAVTLERRQSAVWRGSFSRTSRCLGSEIPMAAGRSSGRSGGAVRSAPSTRERHGFRRIQAVRPNSLRASINGRVPMASHVDGLKGPDLAEGIPFASLRDGDPVEGHVSGEPVLLVRRGDNLFAVGAKCTHYGAPLADGIVVGDTVRCPWHHACFSLRSGEALAAPAFDPLARWSVERRGDLIVVGRKLETVSARPARAHRENRDHPRRIIIVGGGAAGFACAEMLRRQGFDGELTMLSADDAPPCDRPNLSKDYLAGED